MESARAEKEMMRHNQRKAMTATDPIEKLRAQCLARGASGIKGLGRAFRIVDDDNSKSLEYNEFKKGMENYGVYLDSEQEYRNVFEKFDADGSGSVDFEEFLRNLRPPMNNRRRKLVAMAFNKMDKDGSGHITIDDLKGVYDVTKHPKFRSGEWTEDQILDKFLAAFDTPDDYDGKVMPDEWMQYYEGVSASIDQDAYFDLMMRRAWKL